ncbi:MAG: rod shape-determining protein [bacterium]|nr:rod shape-determining protein [bacterium]
MQFSVSSLLAPTAGLYLDVGSNRTKVVINGRVVYDQPTCITWHRSSMSVIDVGDKALLSLHKTNDAFACTFPVERGHVAQPELFIGYLEAVLNQLPWQRSWWQIQAKGAFAIPNDTSPIQRQQLLSILQRVGLSGLQLITKTEAIQARLAQLHQQEKHACIVDIGGGSTEAGLFFESRCLQKKTIPLGGIDFTTALQVAAQREYQVAIGWQTAEELKAKPDSFWPMASTKLHSQKMTVRAKDIIRSVPTTVVVELKQLQPELLQVVDELIDEITQLLGTVSPEVLTQSLDQGLYLTGGGSLLPGLSSHIADKLKCQIIPAHHPFQDVVQGLFTYGKIQKKF